MNYWRNYIKTGNGAFVGFILLLLVIGPLYLCLKSYLNDYDNEATGYGIIALIILAIVLGILIYDRNNARKKKPPQP